MPLVKSIDLNMSLFSGSDPMANRLTIVENFGMVKDVKYWPFTTTESGTLYVTVKQDPPSTVDITQYGVAMVIDNETKFGPFTPVEVNTAKTLTMFLTKGPHTLTVGVDTPTGSIITTAYVQYPTPPASPCMCVILLLMTTIIMGLLTWVL